MWALAACLVALGQVSTEPADRKKEPWDLSTAADELKQLQGTWEVRDAQASAGVERLLPKETGLTEKGTRLVIRGNELLRDGKVIATLANDLSEMGPEWPQGIRVFRRPLLITMPDGKAVLCAYDKRTNWLHLDIAYPPTMGNVGAGQRVYLGRPTK
jgi:hypothetical protein